MKTCIELFGMEFHACHGLLPQERTAGNTYRVGLRLYADIALAMQTDEVCHTIDYAHVYQTVKEEMAIPSCLLEHVAGRIALRLFNDYPAIQSLWLKVEKLNPPMPGIIASSAVCIEMSRSECMEQLGKAK